MNRFFFRIITSLIAIVFLPIAASGEIIYTMGNSLTVDALYNYKGAFNYSIQCNQNLQTIFDNPSGTCSGGPEPNAVPWDVAFTTQAYDFVTVQPFYFTTLDQDFQAISTWMNLQPNAKFVLHTGWANVAAESVYDQPLVQGGQFVHSKAHIDALLSRISAAFPGRPIGNTNLIGTLESIRQDIALGVSPIPSLNDLYRDQVHFNALGQYVATNSFYLSMGKPIDETAFQSIAPAHRAYLNAKMASNVVAVPESSSIFLSVFVFASAFYCRIRRLDVMRPAQLAHIN